MMKLSCLLLSAAWVVAGCSGKGDGPAASGAAGGTVAQWCQAQPGMTKEALVGLMGKPESMPPGSMTWSSGHYGFNAFLEDDGTVRQLDINQVDLTPQEKASLPCRPARSVEGMAAAAAEKKAATYRPACDLVPAADMSSILGAAMTAEGTGKQGSTQSKCVYTAASGKTPYAELEVDRGEGESGMAGVGLVQSSDSRIGNPYAGIGDQAVSVGPALFIRTGDDFMTIVVSGVQNRPVVAKKIFDAAKAGM